MVIFSDFKTTVMRVLLFCILFYSTIQCHGQNDKSRLINKLESSPECLSVSSYVLASIYFKEGNIDSTDYYLNISITCDKTTLCRLVMCEKQAISQGIKPPPNTFLIYAKKSFPLIANSCSQSDIDKYKESQKSKKKITEANIDSTLLNTIKRIKYEDQRIRKDGFYERNLKIAQRIDSIHLHEIDSIIHKYGRYPGRSLVGEDNESVAAMVIHHNSIEAGRYLDILKNAVLSHDLGSDWYQIVLKRYLSVKYGLNSEQVNLIMISDAILSDWDDDMKDTYMEMKPFINIKIK